MSDADSTTMIHVAGPCIQFGSQQRQRCSWCGFVLIDDDLSRMAFQIPEDGSTPEPPRGFPFEQFVEVTVASGFRGSSLVETDPEPDGSVKVPEGCCMHLPAELTGTKETV